MVWLLFVPASKTRYTGKANVIVTVIFKDAQLLHVNVKCLTYTTLLHISSSGMSLHVQFQTAVFLTTNRWRSFAKTAGIVAPIVNLIYWISIFLLVVNRI